ncbi:hypothetical protein [Roseomonas indoligenes]|uniref:Uncharacterized protein n=1 Tax=Roseomonas indoligenes TaxID=2820811 RepID=A0A940N4C3_9PROT|nr:hypothetical protein [Pararoseomonas indoligenes]MBP0494945.1 hypothetical protein [Pararoseomonas indoligenes]
MRSGLRTAILAIMGATAGNLAAAPEASATPSLLCGRDEVIRIVARTVRQWNQYNRIVDGSAVEAPTDRANAVICYATMTSVGYELTPEGWIPRRHEELRRYDVQVLANRLYVQVQP